MLTIGVPAARILFLMKIIRTELNGNRLFIGRMSLWELRKHSTDTLLVTIRSGTLITSAMGATECTDRLRNIRLVTTHLNNGNRPVDEHKDWFGLPYIVGEGDSYEVRCYDGGAWDRSTGKAFGLSLYDAIEVVKANYNKY